MSSKLVCWLKSRGRTVSTFSLSILSVIVLWQFFIWLAKPQPYLLPSPLDVSNAAWQTRNVLGQHFLTTLLEALAGLIVGAFVGAAIAIGLTLNRTIRQLVEPVLVISQSIPAVILAPLFIVWFGFGFWPKAFVVVLVTLFPIALATLSGFDSVNKDLMEMFDSYRPSTWQRLKHLQIPSATEEMFAGLKIASSYSIFGAVVGEWMGASSGLGVYLQRSQASFKTDQIFAAVALIAMASVILFSITTALAAMSMPWKSTPSKHQVANQLNAK